MRIVIDAFGGDNAPLAPIKGARLAKDRYGVSITLVGKTDAIKKCAAENKISLEGLDLYQADGVFSVDDDPTDIIKSGKNTSLAVACQLVADGMGDAVVSAGSTGALVVGGTFIIKRINGVKRAAIGTLIPGENKPFFMMDVGANAECRPEMLLQFAIMSSVYCKNVLGMDEPTVGLLNIGTEKSKGTELQKETYKLLCEAPVKFIGNVEAREVPNGAADIVIADGFTGNIALKLYEGVAEAMFGAIKKIYKKNVFSKLSALMVKDGLMSLKKKNDYSEVGGAALLGVRKCVIKAHGSSDAKAFCHAVKQAMDFCENDVVAKISNDLR